MTAAPQDMTATRRVVATLGATRTHRVLPEEVPVALVVNGATLAVMMATPSDLEDFARGFVLTEGIAPAAEVSPEACDVEVVHGADGIEARLWLPETRAEALRARRRASVGPVGCGLCGIDSLAAAARALPNVAQVAATLDMNDIPRALAALRNRQPLHDETHAVHAAGFWQSGSITCAREDVGRHNALDKLAGALLRGTPAAGSRPDGSAGTLPHDTPHRSTATDIGSGAIVLTSRLSLDMVQKAVQMGAGIVLSVSAPTAHAVRVAEAAGLTLATHGRGETHIYTHAHRILEVPR